MLHVVVRECGVVLNTRADNDNSLYDSDWSDNYFTSQSFRAFHFFRLVEQKKDNVFGSKCTKGLNNLAYVLCTRCQLIF